MTPELEEFKEQLTACIAEQFESLRTRIKEFETSMRQSMQTCVERIDRDTDLEDDSSSGQRHTR